MATATLPENIAFKGDNGTYLGSIWAEDHPYQQFFASDIGNDRVRFEVFPVDSAEGHGEGHVRIKSLYQDAFWRRSPNWIWADTPANGLDKSNKDLVFHPVQVDQHTVALRCLGNDAYCKRLTADYKNDCLNAGTWTLEKAALFSVEEPVIRRIVHSVVYDVDHAEIYDEHPLVLATNTATNSTGQTAEMELSFSYTDRKSISWSNSVSFTTGISATFTAGVPEVASSSVTVSFETSTNSEWGKEVEVEKTEGANYHVKVDPGKTVKVNLQVTHAKCNVKFSYVQEDLLTTGYTNVITKNDGVYKGMNYTNIRYVASYI